MRKLVRIRAGEAIPEGARFIEAQDERGHLINTTEELVHRGWIYDRVRYVNHYAVHRVYIYEVECAEQATK